MIKKVLDFYRRTFWNNERYAKHIGVKIGADCKIATTHFGSEPYLISIGDRVQITQGVRFFNHGAAWVFRDKEPDFDVFGKITIGNKVYIGNNALIMPGVTINDNVIVGAGAIVTKSVQEGNIVAGNPAKPIGKINDLKCRLNRYNLKTKGMSYKDKRDFLMKQQENSFLRK